MQTNIIPIYSCSTWKLSMINNVSGALEAPDDEFNSPIDYVDDGESVGLNANYTHGGLLWRENASCRKIHITTVGMKVGMWGIKVGVGSVMRKFAWCFDCGGRVSRPHWCLLCPADSWLGNGNCCALWKDFPMKTERGRQAASTETKGAFNGDGSVGIGCWTWRGLWCDGEKPRGLSSLQAVAGPVHCGGWQVFWGVTSTQSDKPLWYDYSSHPPPHPSPSFYDLGQLSEDPSPGTTTGKDGDSDSASHSFSPHHFTLNVALLCLLPLSFSFFFFFSGFRGSLCSFCVYRTFTRVSPRHTPHVTPPSTATLPGARRSLRLALEKRCDTFSPAHSSSITLMEEELKPL